MEEVTLILPDSQPLLCGTHVSAHGRSFVPILPLASSFLLGDGKNSEFPLSLPLCLYSAHTMLSLHRRSPVSRNRSKITQDKMPGNFFLKTSARFFLPAIALKKHWMRFGAQPEGEMPPPTTSRTLSSNVLGAISSTIFVHQKGFSLAQCFQIFFLPKNIFCFFLFAKKGERLPNFSAKHQTSKG